MLTLADALRIPEFATGKLVAGAAGIDNQIEWVHQGDIPDIAEWCQPGELLFTTGLGLQIRPELQKSLIEDLASHGVVGMVVCIGPYLHKIPEKLVERAEQLGFPLVTLPWDVSAINIVRAILQVLVENRYYIMQQSVRIHNELTQIVLEGKGLDAVAESLARLTHCSITIEDDHFGLLAEAPWGRIDPMRRETVEQHHTPRNFIHHLDRVGLLAKIRASNRPLRIDPIPQIGVLYERVVAPIVAGETLLGYAWLIVGGRSVSELDTIAVEHGATVAALVILQERAVREAEQRQKASLLNDMLESGVDWSDDLLLRAERQFPVSRPGIQVLVARNSASTDSLYDGLWLERTAAKLDQPAMIVERASEIVLILNAQKSVQGCRLAHGLIDAGNDCQMSWRMGVGRAYPHWNNVPDSFKEGREALDVGIALGESGATFFEDLGVLYWLRHLDPDVRDENIFRARVIRIVEYDKRRGTDLLHTLEIYLDHGRNAMETARLLCVHRNTLRQRLERVEELMEMNLDHSLVCLNLHVAIKEYRLSTNAQ